MSPARPSSTRPRLPHPDSAHELEPVRFDHKVTPAYGWPVGRFAELLAGAGLVTFARLFHDPASERGFLDAHLPARHPWCSGSPGWRLERLDVR